MDCEAKKGGIRGKEETRGMETARGSKSGMYSDAMKAAAIPIFKLIYRTLYEH
jgi:hypothetical protein